MEAQTSMTHAPNTEAPHCAQCMGFGVVRVATCTARYLPSSLADDAEVEPTEALCASCASAPWAWTDVQPLTPAPARGVSLVKATDRQGGPADVTYVVSEWELDRVRSERNPRYDAVVPSWVDAFLALNDLCSLRRAFAAMAGGVR